MGNILGRYIEAQQYLEVLVQLKSPTRCFKGIWRMEFERPGGHFVYQWKYAKCLAEFAVINNDVSVLGLMYQRVYRADTTFFRRNEFLTELRDYLKEALDIR
jgi:hypothetical protein